MVGHPESDGVSTTRGLGCHLGTPADDEGQRAGPERLGQGDRNRADVTAEAVEPVEVIVVGEVDDQGMTGRSTLGLEDPGHRGRRGGIGPEPVDRLGRERHQLALLEGLGGSLDRRVETLDGRVDQLAHGQTFGQVANARPAVPPPTTRSPWYSTID